MEFDINANISDREFQLLKELMYKETGVFLKPSKKNLIIARLRNRLKLLNIDSFEDYHKLLVSRSGANELDIFVNSITTNETYFFRNDSQLEYMKKEILPKIIHERVRSGANKKLGIWSAASSSGEEAYSIAIFLRQAIPNISSWRLNLYASDINSDVLNMAKEGVYPVERLRKLQDVVKRKYFTKSIDKKFKKELYSLSNEIKSMVTFLKHNLLKPFRYTGLDIIFLNNVLIYFDMESKQQVIDNVSKSLNKGGYLFLGQSESLMGVKHDYKFISPSTYTKEA